MKLEEFFTDNLTDDILNYSLDAFLEQSTHTCDLLIERVYRNDMHNVEAFVKEVESKVQIDKYVV